MALTAEQSANIIDAVQANHSFLPELSIPFHTSSGAVGYIPRSHLDVYTSLEDQKGRSLFLYNPDDGVLKFSDHLNSTSLRTGALKYARESLIFKGLFKPVYVPEPQFRAIGGADRLIPGREEAVIDRNEYRLTGFASDAVFLNVIIGSGTQEPKILLQHREDNGLYDFAAGGAVKFPQTVEDALLAQIKEEMGVELDEIEPIGNTNFKFSTPKKEWVTYQTHNLFQIRKPLIAVGKDYNTEEVQGFVQVTPQEALEICAANQFQRQNVQAFMTSLFIADLVPAFEGREKLKDMLDGYYSPPVIAEADLQTRPANSLTL